MKTKIYIIMFFIALFSCEKTAVDRVTSGTVTFWTTEQTGATAQNGDTGWVLFVDGTRIGSIERADNSIPFCGESGFTRMSLSAGRHYYQLKRTIASQPPPNSFAGDVQYFNVTTQECLVIRAIL